jgi:hypothetical protein
MSVNKEVKRITTHILQEMKNRGEKDCHAYSLRFFDGHYCR